jgi:hypothetical protein
VGALEREVAGEGESLMPSLDVSITLTNPQTLDTFDVQRRTQIVNSFGESKISVELNARVRGVVYPEGLDSLSRRPEAQTQAKSIVVITRFPLRGESETVDSVNYQPDIILWHGDSFLVVRLEDWGSYARGFVKATAESTDIVDKPTNLTANAAAPWPDLSAIPHQSPFGPYPQRDVFYATGLESGFTLSKMPAGQVFVYANGILQDWGNYTVVGQQVSLSAKQGWTIAVVYWA